MGGRGPAEGRKPGGKRGSLRLFVFAREGGEGRADTRAFALGYGEGGAARAPPARPGEDKGAAGDEEEEGDYYFAGLTGGGPPSLARLPLPQLDPSRPQPAERPPRAGIGGTLRGGGGGPGLGCWGHPRLLILLIRASRPNPGLLCVSLDNQQRLPPSLRLGAPDLGVSKAAPVCRMGVLGGCLGALR